MQKLIARTLINYLPMNVLAEIISDDVAMRKRVDRELRRYRNKPTILDDERAGLWL